ncbi:MAG: NUDIX domain-containing protein [Bacteroidaceae bacterium]|nr:NUDIX domain-containing protein [Bacteroidaceae bacterium]
MAVTEGKHLLHVFSHCPKCGSERFVADSEKSKRCEACGFQYFMNPSASTVAIIVDEMGRLLVVRRSKEPAKGTLDLPGGFCDCHETGEEGVRREVMEETGLEVTEARYLFSLPNMYRYSGLDIPTLDLFFLCKVKETGGATAMDDASEVMWLPWQKVKPEDFGLKSISLGVRRLLEMQASGSANAR